MSQDLSSHPSDQQGATVNQLRKQNAGIQSENERLKAELAALTLSVASKQPPDTSTAKAVGATKTSSIQQTDDEGYPSDRSLQDESHSDESTGGVIDLQASSSTSLSSDGSQHSSQPTKSTPNSPSSVETPPAQTKVGSSSTGVDQASL